MSNNYKRMLLLHNETAIGFLSNGDTTDKQTICSEHLDMLIIMGYVMSNMVLGKW